MSVAKSYFCHVSFNDFFGSSAAVIALINLCIGVRDPFFLSVFLLGSSIAMGFIGFAMGAVLVFSAFGSAGIGPGFLSFVLWLLFGYFWGLPPLIGLLSTWELWKRNEALAGLVIQILLFFGALWAFQAAGLGDLTILFVVFSAINGVLMAPAMIQEKKDEVKKLEADNSD